MNLAMDELVVWKKKAKVAAEEFSDKLLKSAVDRPSKLKIAALNQVFTRKIPFNAPHGIKITSILPQNTGLIVELPYKRSNWNHLKGQHAGAIVTMGEFCAGVYLLATLGSTKYRLILSKLEAVYTYQGRETLNGQAGLSPEQLRDFRSVLEERGEGLITLETHITDQHKNSVAKVSSTWQLKSWDKVRLK